jgi:hypothetical protein
MGFDAANVVEPLDWDFTKFGDKDDKGTVPEPTDRAIETFFKDVAKATKEVLKDLGMPEREIGSDADAASRMIETIAEISPDTPITTKMFDALFRATARLCSNQPSLTQLKKLPLRVRIAFVTWLMGELNPEPVGAASRNLGVAPGLNGALGLPAGFTRGG